MGRKETKGEKIIKSDVIREREKVRFLVQVSAGSLGLRMHMVALRKPVCRRLLDNGQKMPEFNFI